MHVNTSNSDPLSADLMAMLILEEAGFQAINNITTKRGSHWPLKGHKVDDDDAELMWAGAVKNKRKRRRRMEKEGEEEEKEEEEEKKERKRRKCGSISNKFHLY